MSEKKFVPEIKPNHVEVLREHNTLTRSSVLAKRFVPGRDADKQFPTVYLSSVVVGTLIEQGYAVWVDKETKNHIKWTGKEYPAAEVSEKPADEDVWPEWEEMTREQRSAAAWAAGPGCSKMDFLRVVQFLREELVMEQESHNAARRVIADMYSRAEEYYNS